MIIMKNNDAQVEFYVPMIFAAAFTVLLIDFFLV